MMLSWRLKLREAEEALKHGRLDAAERLVQQHQLIRYRPGQRLAERLGISFAQRARETASRGEIEDAWRDLARAKSLDASPELVSESLNKIIEAGAAQVCELLQREEAERALSRLADMELLGISDARLDRYRRAAESYQTAGSLASCGRFVDAEDQLDAASELLPELATIAARRKAIRERAAQCRRLTGELRSLLTAEDWDRALAIADQILDVAPQYKVARDARRRSVDELSRVVSRVEAPAGSMTVAGVFESSRQGGQDLQSIPSPVDRDAGDASDVSVANDRFILWVDGVGGYLTCLASTLTIGQALPDSRTDIPIQGDISAKHAIIKRVGDEYLIEPSGCVSVAGRRITEPFGLSDGDEIRLGNAVGLRFCRPHALSASARLDFVTRHRTHPWTDGIILMAESCVLGPNRRNHVFCRDWRDDVVLFRQDADLHCRAMESLEIDGEFHDSSGRVTLGSHIAGEDFSITLERA